MAGLNQVNIIGRLGKDCEVKFTSGGMAVANFTVATSESWVDKQSNEKKEKTEWHRIVAWGKLAEICGEYLQKGKLVYVCGSLQTRSWEQDGVTKYTTEIKIKDMQMLDSKQSGQSQQKPAGPRSSQQQRPAQQSQQNEPPPFDDSQIPF